jgi:acyl dehydratase
VEFFSEGKRVSIDYRTLKEWAIAPRETTYNAKDTILYALGVGLGVDPLDQAQLDFLYEARLKALPTMALTLSYPGFWLQDPATGVDYQRTLHGEQSIEFHAPLPVEGTVIDKVWVDEILDKGPDKGAFVYARSTLTDKRTGRLIATLAATMVCRADGGFGGPVGDTRAVQRPPSGPPDTVYDLQTSERAALLYRLTGDTNPLHVDPSVAHGAGFDRPILHGLCTLGIAGHALLRTLCSYDSSRMKRIEGRFTAPAYPGETIRTEIWHVAPGEASFRCRIVERDVIVLNSGRFCYHVQKNFI